MGIFQIAGHAAASLRNRDRKSITRKIYLIKRTLKSSRYAKMKSNQMSQRNDPRRKFHFQKNIIAFMFVNIDTSYAFNSLRIKKSVNISLFYSLRTTSQGSLQRV